MPYNRRYSDPIPYDDAGGGPTTRLIQSLIGIQDRKTQRARQAEMDRIAEEDRQRQIKTEDEDRALKFAEIQYRIAAEQNRPKETVDKTVATTSLKAPEPLAPMTPEEQALHNNTGEPLPPPPIEDLQATLPDQPQGVPDELPLTVKEEVASPIPTQRLTMGGQTIERQMPDLGETQARADEDFKRRLMQEGQLAEARDIDVQIPNDPKYGALAGMRLPKTVASIVLGQAQKPVDPFANYKGVGGGYLEKGPDGRVSFRDTTPPTSGTAAGDPPKTETIGGRLMGWNPATQKFDIDYGAAGRAVTVTSGQMAQNRTSALQAMGKPTDSNGDTIWALTNRVFTKSAPSGGVAGVRAKASGIGDMVRGWSGYDPEAQIYSSQIRGFIPLFARAVGHTGVLTELDVQRTEALFPQFGNSKEIANRKMTRLNAIMAGKEAMPAGVFEPREGHWPPVLEDPASAGGGVGSGVDTGTEAWEEVAPGVRRRKK
jgi:hypothetical protein